jgi:hypothetical protein
MDQAQFVVDQATESIIETTEMEYEDLRESTVGFSSKNQTTSEEGFNYGYGIVAFGAALATATFLYKKNQ